MNERPELGTGVNALIGRVWVEPDRSNFRALRQLEGMFDVIAEVADGALYLGMPKKDLPERTIGNAPSLRRSRLRTAGPKAAIT